MKIIDCFWEHKNIGRKTAEVLIETTDSFKKHPIERLCMEFEYVVVKVPMNMIEYNIGLSRMGFICIETQMHVGININDFDFSKINHLYDDTFYENVDSNEKFMQVINNLQPGMFSTDRISIDSHFGMKIANQRYVNWLTSEYENKRSQLVKVIHKNEHIGFMLFKIEGNIIRLILNGLYNQYQGMGLGTLTPASPIMYAKKNSLNIAEIVTNISSNNIPVVKLYSRLNYQIIQQSYVYVKHSF